MKQLIARLILNWIYWTAGHWVGYQAGWKRGRRDKAAVRVVLYCGASKIKDGIIFPDAEGEFWIDTEDLSPAVLGDIQALTTVAVSRIGIITP